MFTISTNQISSKSVLKPMALVIVSQPHCLELIDYDAMLKSYFLS